MEFTEARQEFIQIWGAFGSNWGINKAMAQIHALLLATEEPLTTDDIMEQLQISRSNANLNIRALVDWGLVYKKHVPGDRKEYFVADKNMWDVAIKITRERRKREVDPIVREIQSLSQFDANNTEEKKFKRVLAEINDLADLMLKMGDLLERADKVKFLRWIVKGI